LKRGERESKPLPTGQRGSGTRSKMQEELTTKDRKGGKERVDPRCKGKKGGGLRFEKVKGVSG